MMSLNRYRLRHQRKKSAGARRAAKLLAMPDRLIGLILIGNNAVNILAAIIANMLAVLYVGEAAAPWVATASLTITVLVFSEVTPKTIAAQNPEWFAFKASHILKPLLQLLSPLVWMVNKLTNAVISMLGFDPNKDRDDGLDTEELKSLVDISAHKISDSNQGMLKAILDLESVTVEDIMIPRNEIVGIDINDDISTILNTISQSPHTRIPLYQEELNNVVGMVHVRQILPLMYAEKPSKEEFLALAQEPYFVPESTPLNTQLLNFQKRKYWVALVVDEYGDIQGLTTLEDILEEIVGDMAEEQDLENDDIHAQEDGSFFIDGTTTVRDINKALTWSLPIDGPKTLNGLITERLEEIPQFNVCLKLGEYHLETVQIRGNFIKTVRLHRVEVTTEEVH